LKKFLKKNYKNFKNFPAKSTFIHVMTQR